MLGMLMFFSLMGEPPAPPAAEHPVAVAAREKVAKDRRDREIYVEACRIRDEVRARADRLPRSRRDGYFRREIDEAMTQYAERNGIAVSELRRIAYSGREGHWPSRLPDDWDSPERLDAAFEAAVFDIEMQKAVRRLRDALYPTVSQVGLSGSEAARLRQEDTLRERELPGPEDIPVYRCRHEGGDGARCPRRVPAQALCFEHR